MMEQKTDATADLEVLKTVKPEKGHRKKKAARKKVSRRLVLEAPRNTPAIRWRMRTKDRALIATCRIDDCRYTW